MLTIWMGRAKTGKSAAVLEQIRTLGDHGKQILLVPEHVSHLAEIDLCRVCGPTVSRHAEVLSFRRLGERVLSLTGGLSQVTLDAGGKLLTMQKALSEVAASLTVYRRPSQKAAFLQQLLDLTDELRSYEVTPQMLYEQAEQIPGATGEKLRDLSLLYGAYEARLRRPGLDARDRMSKLCDHLEESGYAAGKDIFLDGFTYFNAQERRVLSILLRQARSVTVNRTVGRSFLKSPSKHWSSFGGWHGRQAAAWRCIPCVPRIQGLCGTWSSASSARRNPMQESRCPSIYWRQRTSIPRRSRLPRISCV